MLADAAERPATVVSEFDAVARRHRRRTALIDGQRTSYTALAVAVRTFAKQLSDEAIRPGDRLVLSIENSLEYVVAFFGTLVAGAVACPADPRWTIGEYERLYSSVRPSATLVSYRQSQGTRTVPREALPGLESPDRGPVPVIEVMPQTTASAGSPDAHVTAFDTSFASRPEEPAAIFQTSGTTGEPGLVVHSHETMLACVRALRATRRQYFALSPRRLPQLAQIAFRYRRRVIRPALDENVWLTPLPFSSIAGQVIMMQAVLNGHALVVMRRFDPRETLRLVERESVTYLAVNPTIAELCLRVAERDNREFRSLFVIGIGGSHASPTLAKRVMNRFHCGIAIGYGSTELGGGILASSVFDPRELQLDTVGRAFPGTSVRIVDADDREVPRGDVGELVTQSPGLMLGYETSTGLAAGVDKAGWYHTGDLAMMDEAGYVRIVGRSKDLIIRAGQNIYPREVEEVLEGHPAVAGSAVVGVPDPLAGERVWAFVTRAPSRDVAEGELMAFCRDKLASWKIPDRVEFMDALPVTPDGKTKKYVLRRLALAKQLDLQGVAIGDREARHHE